MELTSCLSKATDNDQERDLPWRFFHYCSISGEAVSSFRQECDSSRRLAGLPGLRDAGNVAGHYLSLDKVVPGFGLPMKSRESMLVKV
jgi:hypothetical protein